MPVIKISGLPVGATSPSAVVVGVVWSVIAAFADASKEASSLIIRRCVPAPKSRFNEP